MTHLFASREDTDGLTVGPARPGHYSGAGPTQVRKGGPDGEEDAKQHDPERQVDRGR